MNGREQVIERFQASLARVKAQPEFLERFYASFVGSHPEIAAIFRGRDMSLIQAKLLTTLDMLDGSAANNPGLGMYLELLGRVHARLNISQAMFAQWRDALLETIEECDLDLSDEDRAAWRFVVGELIERMQSYADE